MAANLPVVLLCCFRNGPASLQKSNKNRGEKKPKPPATVCGKPSRWCGQSVQILLNYVGCEARKLPAGGEVFFLDFSSQETPSSLSWCDLEAQFGCFLPEELDLLAAISVFVVLSAFVNVSLTILQHSIDQSGEPVGHRRNGLRGTELGAQPSVLCSEVGATAHQGDGRHPQRCGRAIDHPPGASGQHLVSTGAVVRA